jgi:hypothetical protein
MEISGTITNAQSHPVANVRVDMSIGGVRAAILYTDGEGRFSHTDTSRAAGRLSLRAETAGYIPQEITRPTTESPTVVDIVLVPASAAPPWQRIVLVAGAAIALIAIVVALVVALTGRPEDPVIADPPSHDPTPAEEPPIIDRPLPPVMTDRTSPVERIERLIPPLVIERPVPPRPVDGPVPVNPLTVPERPGGVR